MDRAKNYLPALLALLAAECLFYALFLSSPRIPRGSDGFQYFALQYFFLNHAVTAGETPLWIPFLTHGNLAAVPYLSSSGALQQIALSAGPLLGSAPFLSIFYSGFLVEELILVAGTWLLGRRFIRSTPGLLVACASAAGSCVWADSPWFNFHLFYALPLLLHWLHRFLETGRWRYLTAAGCFFAYQCFGSLAYFVPLLSLTVFLYFLFFALFNRTQWPDCLSTTPQRLAGLGAGLLIVIAWAVPLLFLLAEASWVVRYNPGRNPDASVTLSQFLSYGGNLSPWNWLELATGISPHLEFTLYAGLLTPFLALLGLILEPRKNFLHFYLMVAVLFFFSQGGKIASFFYTVWPFMYLYRHVGLTAVLAKPFLCLAAGIGLDILGREMAARPGRQFRTGIAALAAVLWGAVLLGLCRHADGFSLWFKTRFPANVSWMPEAAASGFFGDTLFKSGLLAAGAGVLLFLGCRVRQNRLRSCILVLIALAGCLDVFSYKYQEALRRTRGLAPRQDQILAYQQIPYESRRDPDFWKNNPRARTLFPDRFKVTYQIAPSKPLSIRDYLLKTDLVLAQPWPLFYLRDQPWYHLFARSLTGYGADLWLLLPFFFHDTLGSPFRVDSWSPPFDRVIRAFWGKGAREWNDIIPLLDRLSRGLILTRHPVFLKIAGASEDKIQFFSGAFRTRDDEETAKLLTDKDYAGDLLFLTPPKSHGPAERVPVWQGQRPLASSSRVSISYKVERYNANHLVVRADTGPRKSIWIYYSDIWHPGWRASVNGRPAPVWRANLGYKAVRLEPGANEIHFYFSQPGIALAQTGCALLAGFWIVVILKSIKPFGPAGV
ncbi:MAG: hypothetical protein HY714_02350 [Candidatus Omnitrophica bacterium]|nr:hypothetical protein [Candidatus Omnitrophota bacterium]